MSKTISLTKAIEMAKKAGVGSYPPYVRRRLDEEGITPEEITVGSRTCKRPRLNNQDVQEFGLYLKNCTDTQLIEVYRKENKANRHIYAKIAYLECISCGLAPAHS